ncbi:helix-turn-helix domain-containing protein [Bradyrhizobium sp. 174]|nr:helix-turn-helix domain-containing protein [Bradyrhizobium sp. 174]
MARARLHRTFSISDLAKAAGLGLRTFARRCERATGLSRVKFVQRLRVDRATELLDKTRLGLDEIAEKVGTPTPLRFASSCIARGRGCASLASQLRE